MITITDRSERGCCRIATAVGRCVLPPASFTNLKEGHFETEPGMMVHLQPYRLPKQKEMAEMLKQNRRVAQLVVYTFSSFLKKDWYIWFCVD